MINAKCRPSVSCYFDGTRLRTCTILAVSCLRVEINVFVLDEKWLNKQKIRLKSNNRYLAIPCRYLAIFRRSTNGLTDVRGRVKSIRQTATGLKRKYSTLLSRQETNKLYVVSAARVNIIAAHPAGTVYF